MLNVNAHLGAEKYKNRISTRLFSLSRVLLEDMQPNGSGGSLEETP
jgi:hypothetical protein